MRLAAAQIAYPAQYGMKAVFCTRLLFLLFHCAY